MEVVELASLLHDVQDWKYSGSVTAGAAAIQVKDHTCGLLLLLIQGVYA